MRNVVPTEAGTVQYEPVSVPTVDPLKLLDRFHPRQFEYYYDEAEWLKLTEGCEYPDGVVALTRHMLWQDNVKDIEAEFAPDLVVTARPRWYFGQTNTPGTTHGYPLADSMRATLFFSGPNIRRGARLENPCRLADLTPTILEMVGVNVDPSHFDGKPLRTIYMSPETGVQQADLQLVKAERRPKGLEVLHSLAENALHPDLASQAVATARASSAARPVYWDQVNLHAWGPLSYTPRKTSPYVPITVNDPDSPLDINNIVYNVLTVGEISVLRLLDDVAFPLADENQRLGHIVEEVDQQVRRAPVPPVSEAAETLDVPGVSLSDYSFTSLGNLQRADRTIDWMQARSREAELVMNERTRKQISPGSKMFHATIDGVQGTFWEVYRLGQRVVLEFVDEQFLNGLENGTDRTINAFQRLPAEEVIAPEPDATATGNDADAQR